MIEEKNLGLKMLVDMAKKGEIDPWNVDIIQVTDRYLALLAEEEFHDLRLYGRLLFYASVLLRMKAEIVGGIEQPFADDFIEGDEFIPSYAENGNGAGSEHFFSRLTFRNGDIGVVPRIPRPRRRPLTLADLIRELKRLEKTQGEKFRQSLTNGSTTAEAIKSTHTDDIERDIATIQTQLERLFHQQKRIEFRQLISEEMPVSQTFLAVLFLAARLEIELEQETWYAQLYIRKRE